MSWIQVLMRSGVSAYPPLAVITSATTLCFVVAVENRFAPSAKTKAEAVKADIQYIEPSELASWLRTASIERGPVQVVDVREGDYTRRMCKIKGAINFPANQIRADNAKGLLDIVREEPNLVFHCMYSQQRGPTSSQIYKRAAATGEFARQQNVYVLRGGFDRFYKQYGGSCPDLFEPVK